MLVGLVLMFTAFYIAMPYNFSGEQLWSEVVSSGGTTGQTLTVRVCRSSQAEAPDHAQGLPLTIFWRRGYQPWCHQKTVVLNSDGFGLSYSCDGTMVRISGGGEERRWAMSVFLHP